ncbi:hypothetical protein IEQ34_018229 [Dendrobium chrysotoxum]|uniref:Arginine and glutamate-rich protein 1 n=1 Tax=Dendrobium chrysotoxum TaxID=161865 RepID=A0AAV7GDU8_DENCH|nr:hypothetical protein IEQ34_018229 [Dendrobium chrysotoxum]
MYFPILDATRTVPTKQRIRDGSRRLCESLSFPIDEILEAKNTPQSLGPNVGVGDCRVRPELSAGCRHGSGPARGAGTGLGVEFGRERGRARCNAERCGLARVRDRVRDPLQCRSAGFWSVIVPRGSVVALRFGTPQRPLLSICFHQILQRRALRYTSLGHSGTHHYGAVQHCATEVLAFECSGTRNRLRGIETYVLHTKAPPNAFTIPISGIDQGIRCGIYRCLVRFLDHLQAGGGVHPRQSVIGTAAAGEADGIGHLMHFSNVSNGKKPMILLLRRSPSPSPRWRKSRSPTPRRRKSRSPSPRRHRRQRSRSTTQSPIKKSPSPSVRSIEQTNSIEKLRKEEEEKKRRQKEAELKLLEEETARRVEEAIRKMVEETLNSEEVKLEIEKRITEGRKKLLEEVDAQLEREKETFLTEARKKAEQERREREELDKMLEENRRKVEESQRREALEQQQKELERYQELERLQRQKEEAMRRKKHEEEEERASQMKLLGKNKTRPKLSFAIGLK